MSDRGWWYRKLSLQAICLALGCSSIPQQARTPAPIQIILRAELAPDSSGAARRYGGPLVFADADSVVFTDMQRGERIALRSGPSLKLEVYRGQRSSADAVVKGAAKAGLFGALVGIAGAVVGVAVSEVVGGGGASLADWVRAGAVSGAAGGVMTGALQGAQEGEAVWEKVTIRELRQQICKCPDPDAAQRHPAERLIP